MGKTLGTPHQRKLLQEKCGLVALYSPHLSYLEQLRLLITAGYGVQHRGQLGFGIAYQTDDGIFRYTANGFLKDGLTDEVIQNFPKASKDSYMLLHCRYATDGDDDSRNLQPCIEEGPNHKQWAVIHNGQFTKIDEMREKASALYNEKYPKGVSDTFLFTKLLVHTKKKSPANQILSVMRQMNGSMNLAIGVEDQLFIIRDSFGLRPFVMAKIDKGYIVTSETSALDQINTVPLREIHRGEILQINKSGLTVLKKGYDNGRAFCAFEIDYFARADSRIPLYKAKNEGSHPKRWTEVGELRKQIGIALAGESQIPKVDYVIGIPDSGIPFALGYAQGANLPYNPLAIEKKHAENIPRTFQTDNQIETIENRIKNKYIFITAELKGKRIAIGDDSLVRGKTSRVITKILMEEHGVKEIHWLFGFPKVLNPCHLGISIRTKAELMAYQEHENEEKIAKTIGATSITYVSPFGYLAGLKGKNNVIVPKNPAEIFLANGYCGGCMTGIYPVSKDGQVYVLEEKRKKESTQNGRVLLGSTSPDPTPQHAPAPLYLDHER